MGRPTPPYMPVELIDQAASIGLTPKGYAEHLGFRPNRFYTFFGNPHSKLKPYISICNAADITLDDLASILKKGKFESLIEKLQKKTNCPTVLTLAAELGISGEFIYQRIRNPGVNGLGSYIEMSKALKWKLDKLGIICLRSSKIYTPDMRN